MPKFTKDEIRKYYEVLGLNPDDEGFVMKDSINLLYIGDLYELNEFDRKLSYTSKELSDNYTLFLQMIKDGFWYNTKKRRDNAFNSAFEIIDDLSKFDIEVKDNEELTIDRRNNLMSTIIKGLCEVGDIIDFRLYQKNASFKSIYNKITNIETQENTKNKLGFDEEENTPEDLKKLYYLIAYSKFKDDGSDFEMFDGIGKVSLLNLKVMIKRRLNENAPLNGNLNEREKENNPKVLRLSRYKKDEERV